MKIVFLDRDGTLIEESDDGKIDTLAKLAYKPGVFEGLRSLREAGYELVMVTNQNGIGSEEFPWEAFDLVQDVLMEKFEEQGIRFFDVCICPHLPEDLCECRKPQIGLVKDLIWECEMEPEKSWMIGDRDTDIEFAKNLAIRSVFLKNERFELGEEWKGDSEPEVYQAGSFLEAVERVLDE